MNDQPDAGSPFALVDAGREQTKLLIFMIGPSGSGKTLSALYMARGLIGPAGKLGVIDTEQKRASFFAGKVKFSALNLTAPFTPDRYVQALDACEKSGCDAIVIDSGSHEHEGIGGMLEMAENSTLKSDLAKWAFPKSRHKKFMNRLIQSPCHVIICFRAREKFKQTVNPDTGKSAVINDGWTGIHERNMPYEATVSMLLLPRAPGVEIGERVMLKCPEELLPIFTRAGWINEDTGRELAGWLGGAIPVDKRAEGLRSKALEAGLDGMAALKHFWDGLPKDERALLRDGWADIKASAEAVDAERKRIEGETDRV